MTTDAPIRCPVRGATGGYLSPVALAGTRPSWDGADYPATAHAGGLSNALAGGLSANAFAGGSPAGHVAGGKFASRSSGSPISIGRRSDRPGTTRRVRVFA